MLNIESLLPPKRVEEDEELFLCDVSGAALKDIMPQMEHPFYSLSKKPETKIRLYEHNGNTIEITPSVKGMATIYDKDILIYAISQLMAKIKKNEKVTQKLKINARSFLLFSGRGEGGKDYLALSDALARLSGTRIVTNIKTGQEEQTKGFGLIDNYSIKKSTAGRLQWIELDLSEWIFNAIREKEVLTLDRKYFSISKPINRRIYEVCRKHCGKKASWCIGISLLHKKTGSGSVVRRFRATIKELAAKNDLPEYNVFYLEEDDQVKFTRKSTATVVSDEKPIISDTNTYDIAKSFITDGVDVYFIESEWIAYWNKTGRQYIADPDKAFVGFVKNRYKRKTI